MYVLTSGLPTDVEWYAIVDIYGKASEVEMEGVSAVRAEGLGALVCSKQHALELSKHSEGSYRGGWNCDVCRKVRRESLPTLPPPPPSSSLHLHSPRSSLIARATPPPPNATSVRHASLICAWTVVATTMMVMQSPLLCLCPPPLWPVRATVSFLLSHPPPSSPHPLIYPLTPLRLMSAAATDGAVRALLDLPVFARGLLPSGPFSHPFLDDFVSMKADTSGLSSACAPCDKGGGSWGEEVGEGVPEGVGSGGKEAAAEGCNGR